MIDRSIRPLVTLAAAAGFVASASGAPAFATAVGPNQYFQGLVNSRSADATIEVLCAGPGSVGHILPNQSIAVRLAVPSATTNEGYTGTDATSIVAWLSWPTAAVATPVKVAAFTAYTSVPIPTTIPVPCSGSAVVSFVPDPASGAKPVSVDVTLLDFGG